MSFSYHGESLDIVYTLSKLDSCAWVKTPPRQLAAACHRHFGL